MRPKEAGRNVIVKRSATGACVDVNQPPFNARTRVHEYGGGDYSVSHGIVCFSNFSDQRLYRQDGPDATPQPLTAPGEMRYADSCMDQARGRLICVREDHTREGAEAVNSIVSVNLEPGNEHGTVLVEGNDFYSTPRLSPDGTQLAWLTWNHPNMPWDGCELWVGEFAEDGTLVFDSDGWRAALRSQFFSLNGRLMVFCISLPTAVAGGILRGLPPMAESKEFANQRLSWACRNGFSVCRLTLLPHRKPSFAATSIREFPPSPQSIRAPVN